jgi:RNA polymerase sigma-70 factor (ECF subfamily)
MQRYEKQIYNLVYRALGSKEEAEDLTQDIFLAVFRGTRAFRGESKFSTWLYRISLNHIRNRIKYLSRRHLFAREPRPSNSVKRPSPDQVERLADPAPSPEQWTMTQDLAVHVQQCLTQLPAQFREILVLRDVQDLSYEELCEVLSLNLGTVKSRLHRARTALQECLKDRLD